jgi:hypothetical protein
MPVIQVTDTQVAALRAYLMQDIYAGVRLHRELAESGCLAGYGELMYTAFAEAVRRRFSPVWTRAAVIKYVAAVRQHAPDGQDIDPA